MSLVDFSAMTTHKLEELLDNYMDIMGDFDADSPTCSLVASVVKKINGEILKRKRHFKPCYV